MNGWNKKRELRTGFLVFSFVFFSCLAITDGRISSIDGLIMYKTARSLAEELTLVISPSTERPLFGVYYRSDPSGERAARAKYGPGLSVAAVPLYAVGKAIDPLFSENSRMLFFSPYMRFLDKLAIDFSAPESEQAKLLLKAFDENPGKNIPLLYYSEKSNSHEFIIMFLVTLLCPIIIAVTTALGYLIPAGLGFSRVSSLAAACLAGLCSPLLAYSKNFFSDPLVGLCLMGFVFFALMPGGRKPLHAFISGLFLGYAVLVRPVMAAALVPAYIALYIKYRKGGLHASTFLYAALGVIPGIAGQFIHNRIVTGAFLESGYGEEAFMWITPLLSGLAGLLVSPGKGLLLFCPLLLLAVFSFPGFWRKAPEVALFAASCLVLFLLIYSKWYMWEGGWCWGPRFMVPFIPLALLPLAVLLERFKYYPAWKKFLIIFILVISAVVSFNGILVNWASFYNYKVLVYHAGISGFESRGVENFYELMQWDPCFSPLLEYWGFPNKDYFLFIRALRSEGVPAFKALGMIIFLGWLISGWSLFSFWRKNRDA